VHALARMKDCILFMGKCISSRGMQLLAIVRDSVFCFDRWLRIHIYLFSIITYFDLYNSAHFTTVTVQFRKIDQRTRTRVLCVTINEAVLNLIRAMHKANIENYIGSEVYPMRLKK